MGLFKYYDYYIYLTSFRYQVLDSQQLIINDQSFADAGYVYTFPIVRDGSLILLNNTKMMVFDSAAGNSYQSIDLKGNLQGFELRDFAVTKTGRIYLSSNISLGLFQIDGNTVKKHNLNTISSFLEIVDDHIFYSKLNISGGRFDTTIFCSTLDDDGDLVPGTEKSLLTIQGWIPSSHHTTDGKILLRQDVKKHNQHYHNLLLWDPFRGSITQRIPVNDSFPRFLKRSGYFLDNFYYWVEDQESRPLIPGQPFEIKRLKLPKAENCPETNYNLESIRF